MSLTSWLLFLIYCDSFAFVFLTAILSKGFNMNVLNICRGVIILCLACYMTTKVLIYLFLVEKAYIVRGRRLPRLKDKLYLFNFFGMICPYIGVFILNFIFRFAYVDDNGICIVGMKRVAMIPLLSFEVLVNVYLTLLFVLPILNTYSHRRDVNAALRAVALRTFIGSCATLTSSVVNITVLMVIEGEPGWICMMCCNADILFSVLVLHWVSSPDSSSSNIRTGTPSRALPFPAHDPSDLPFDGTVGGSMPPSLGMSLELQKAGLGRAGTYPRAHLQDKRMGDGDVISGLWSPSIENQRQKGQHGHGRVPSKSQHRRNMSSQNQSQEAGKGRRHQPCVTTTIAASPRDKDVVWRDDMPLDSITVHTEQVTHVEVNSESDNDGDGRSEQSAERGEIGQGPAGVEERAGSTDWIMERSGRSG